MTSASSASAMHTSATEAAVTAAETALRSTAGASAVHGAAETAVRSAGETAAMHTAAKTRLPAGGIMVCQTTMVESTECAGALTRRYVRRSKAAIGAVVGPRQRGSPAPKSVRLCGLLDVFRRVILPRSTIRLLSRVLMNSWPSTMLPRSPVIRPLIVRQPRVEGERCQLRAFQ